MAALVSPAGRQWRKSGANCRKWAARVRMTHIWCVRQMHRFRAGSRPWHGDCFISCHLQGDDVDAQVSQPAKSNFVLGNTGYANEPPLQRFLKGCYEEFKSDDSGAVADYIPELKRANPAHFGVGLVTIDGHVYEVGDSRVPFTIQSVSKAFVFALALDTGRRRARVGGDRGRAERRGVQFDPADQRQPAVQPDGQRRRDRLLRTDPSGRWRTRIRAHPRRSSAGSPAASSTSTTPCTPRRRCTGNRNRAIAWLLRNYSVRAGRRRCGARRLFPAMLDPGHRARSRGDGGDARQPRRQSGDRRAGRSRPTSSPARCRS